MSNAHTQGTSAIKPDGRYTYADYRQWPDEERWELIDGVAWAMSPAPRLIHQRVIGSLIEQLKRKLRGKPCRPFVAPLDVFWTLDPLEPLDTIKDITQPDIMVVCDPGKLIEQGIKGAPDLVIEVLSPSTAWKDQNEKRSLYERHGVREYWMLNPETLETAILRLENGRYGLPVMASLKSPTALQSLGGLELVLNDEELG